MRAGELNRRITIEQFVPQDDGGGGKSGEWQAVGTVWAAVKHLDGQEKQRNDQTTAEVTAEFRLRYISGIKPAMRIVFRGRKFDIKRVNNVNERNSELVITATEVVSTDED